MLLYKRYIYDCRLNKRSTNFLGFKNLISIIKQIEEKIFRKRNTMAKHFQKWEPVSVMLGNSGVSSKTTRSGKDITSEGMGRVGLEFGEGVREKL